MKVSKIRWLNRDAEEAGVMVTDGVFTLEGYSQPCTLKKRDKIDNLVPLEISHLQLIDDPVTIIKRNEPFDYEIVATVKDKNLGIVTIGKLEINLNSTSFPGDISEDDTIRFVASRVACY